MLLSVAVWSGAEDATRDMFHWISAAIAMPTVIFAGQPFFKSAWATLRVGRLGMDVPISLALILASSISLYETMHVRASRLFRRGGDADLLPAGWAAIWITAPAPWRGRRPRNWPRWRCRAPSCWWTGPRSVRPISEVAAGDLVLVRPGGRMPVDGVVIGRRVRGGPVAADRRKPAGLCRDRHGRSARAR